MYYHIFFSIADRKSKKKSKKWQKKCLSTGYGFPAFQKFSYSLAVDKDDFCRNSFERTSAAVLARLFTNDSKDPLSWLMSELGPFLDLLFVALDSSTIF